MVKWVPKKVCFQNPYCQGKPWLLIASLRVSQRLASGLNPSFFKITASALGLKACEILCVCLKYKVSVSYSPLCHLKDKGPSGTSNPCLPDGEPSGWGEWCRAQTLASYGEPLQLLLTSHLWAAYPELWVLIPLHLFPPNLSWCNSFITSLVVKNIFFYFSVYSHQQLLYK